MDTHLVFLHFWMKISDVMIVNFSINLFGAEGYTAQVDA